MTWGHENILIYCAGKPKGKVLEMHSSMYLSSQTLICWVNYTVALQLNSVTSIFDSKNEANDVGSLKEQDKDPPKFS